MIIIYILIIIIQIEILLLEIKNYNLKKSINVLQFKNKTQDLVIKWLIEEIEINEEFIKNNTNKNSTKK